MLSIKMGKEIKQDQHIVANLNVRQTICVAAGVGVGVLLYAVTGASIFELMPVYVLIAVICGAFGWVEKDGMHLEDFAINRAKAAIYHTSKLRYRTQNRYIKLLNAGYKAQRVETAKAAKANKSKKAAKTTTYKAKKKHSEKKSQLREFA